MARTRAALGFRIHTGWAAVVAIAGDPANVVVLLRRRIELLPTDGSIGRFVYHDAAELELLEAARLVKSAEAAARSTTRVAIHEIVQALDARQIGIHAAGIPTGSSAVPSDLGAILGSHALIHAAEGALFLRATMDACEAHGVHAITVREREVWAKAADAYDMDESKLREEVDGMRKSLGPPWGADEKTATVAALLALSPHAGSFQKSSASLRRT